MARCHRIVVALNICEIIVRVKAAEEKGQSSQKTTENIQFSKSKSFTDDQLIDVWSLHSLVKLKPVKSSSAFKLWHPLVL